MKPISKSLNELSQKIVNGELIEPIYNTDELMALLKVSRRTLQDWRDKGLIEFSAIGGKIYYRYSSVIKMLDKHSIKQF